MVHTVQQKAGAIVSSLCSAAVTLRPCRGAETFVNGRRVTEPTVLSSGRCGAHPRLTAVAFCKSQFLNLLFHAFTSRQLHYPGEEPRVPLHPSRSGQGREGKQPGPELLPACGLGLRPERAAGQAGHRHETGNGTKVSARRKRAPPGLCLTGDSPRCFHFRLQELEDQYRKDKEEANNLLEQQRLVRLVDTWETKTREAYTQNAVTFLRNSQDQFRLFPHQHHMVAHSCHLWSSLVPLDTEVTVFLLRLTGQDYESRLEALQKQVEGSSPEAPAAPAAGGSLNYCMFDHTKSGCL